MGETSLLFRGPRGQFRLTVDPEADFLSILDAITAKLPPNVDKDSITLSNAPTGGDEREIRSLGGITFEAVGLG